MDPFSLGTLITGGLSTIGNVFSSIFSTANNNSQAALNRQFQLDMWNRQNAYNHPAAQIGRLEEAGLNPALVYGSVTSGNSQSLPSGAQGSSAQNPDTSALANAFSQVKQLQMQQQVTDADVELKKAQANANDAQAEATRSSIPQKDKELMSTFYKYNLDFRRLQELDKPQLEQLVRKTTAEIDKLTSDIRVNLQSIEESQQRVKLSEAQVDQIRNSIILARKALEQDLKESNSRIALNGSQQNFINTQAHRISYLLEGEKYDQSLKNQLQVVDLYIAKQSKNDRINISHDMARQMYGLALEQLAKGEYAKALQISQIAANYAKAAQGAYNIGADFMQSSSNPRERGKGGKPRQTPGYRYSSFTGAAGGRAQPLSMPFVYTK